MGGETDGYVPSSTSLAVKTEASAKSLEVQFTSAEEANKPPLNQKTLMHFFLQIAIEDNG